jgi:hypothetical protein
VLNRLGSRQVTAMAEQIAGKWLPREVYAQIIDHSDGVPLLSKSWSEPSWRAAG